MSFELTSMNDGKKNTGGKQPDSHPRPGFVNQVCQKWLVHEDSALAQKLQEEEIEMHYGKNRSERKVIQQDLRHAKDAQNEEEAEAQEIRRMYEQMLLDQEMADARVAMQLQEMENLKIRDGEQADKKLAIRLQEKEKHRLERKKKGTDVDRKPDKKTALINVHNGQIENGNSSELSFEPEERAVMANPSDLTVFCLKPTPDMDEAEIARLREEQDAELARLLQEQETKRSGHPDRDRLMAIEAQDRELAKLLQEQERAKVRRAKERAKLKALQKQKEQQLDEESEGSQQMPEEVPTHSASRKAQRPCDLDLPAPHEKRTLTKHRHGSDMPERHPLPLPQPEVEISGHSENIAIAIDPTYNRRQKKSGAHSATLPQALPNSREPNGTGSSGSTPILPSPMAMRTGIYDDEHCYDSDEGPAPPYMPIQGQKRTTSLENKKKSKENCRQQ